MLEARITVNGGEVRFGHPTEWERRTLMANGFQQCPQKEHVMVSSKPLAGYVAKTVLRGGMG